MSTFGEDLIQSLNEALAHTKGKGPAIVHVPVTPREVRKRARLTQAQMGPPNGHGPVRRQEIGTGNAQGQRARRDAVARDPEGT